MTVPTTASRLTWPGTSLLLTILIVWQAGRAGWMPPRRPSESERDPDVLTLRGPAPGPDRVVAEGRLITYPGAEIVVGTELMGMIVNLPVAEKSVVKKGDLIAELKSDDLRAARSEAKARVAEAEADIRLFEREVGRAGRLEARRAGTQSELDTSQRNLATALAQRAAARRLRPTRRPHRQDPDHRAD